MSAGKTRGVRARGENARGAGAGAGAGARAEEGGGRHCKGPDSLENDGARQQRGAKRETRPGVGSKN